MPAWVILPVIVDCAEAWSNRTQSGLPSALLPGVAKLCVPVLAKGEPLIAVNVPALGSYHRAVTAPAKVVIATVSVEAAGQNEIASVPPATDEVVQ